MPITAIASSPAQMGLDGRQSRLAALPASKALVPVESVRPAARSATTAIRRVTPDAALVAHLWATRENAPQTRARRRATHGTARAAYETADGLRHRESGTRDRFL